MPQIIAIEEEDSSGGAAIVEQQEDDIIPGPPSPSAQPSVRKSSSNKSLSGSGDRSGGSLVSRFLNVSGKKQQQRRHTDTAADELQLSNTEHQQRWSGAGILASRDDLLLDPATFAAGCNLLQSAAMGDVPAVQKMLDSGKTHVNFRDYDRRTALHVAASEGRIETVRFLVNAGAKVNRSDRWGGSPLDDANRHRHQAVVEFLRQHGAATGSGNRLTNLIQAAADGDLDEVQTLLSFITKQQKQQIINGTTTNNTNNNNINNSNSNDENDNANAFDIDQGDYDKRTALHLAAGEGHVDIVTALCKAGANVNVQDRWHRRPLDDAMTARHDQVVAVLKSYGAAPGPSGSTIAKLEQEQQEEANNNARHSIMDRSSQRALDNMRIEFNELQMIDRIGSGAFGEIYKCRWRGTLVAAKIIKSAKIRRDWTNRRISEAIASGTDVDDAIRDLDQAEMDVDEKDLAIADFRQEISVLKSLRHPNIVLLLAYSTTENYECLISELMKCSLLDVFKSHLVQGTRMPRRKQIIYATQLAQGMNYLHTCRPPIIHRDLKPANLLIDHSGVLKISDFGLSKVRPDPGTNETEPFVMTGETGSYRFMAPEVFLHKDYSECVDIYSYAMILFYLLVGRPPWPTLAGLDAVRKASDEGDRPTIPRDLDQRLQNLLKECWDEKPSARPPFTTILNELADYSRDAFHTDSNDVLTTHSDDMRCGCAIM